MLLRSDTVEHSGDDGEDHIRQPESYGRRESASVDKHLAETQEEDVGEGEGDADADVPADASTTLL